MKPSRSLFFFLSLSHHLHISHFHGKTSLASFACLISAPGSISFSSFPAAPRAPPTHLSVPCSPPPTPPSILLRAKTSTPLYVSLRLPDPPPVWHWERSEGEGGKRKSCVCLSEAADHRLAPTHPSALVRNGGDRVRADERWEMVDWKRVCCGSSDGDC